MLSHTNLFVYYQKNFAMAQFHRYSIYELETMLPYERDLYFDLILDYVKKQEDK
jgi:hypothetical protein